MNEEKKELVVAGKEQKEADKISDPDVAPVHPIAEAIDSHVLRICDLRQSALMLMKQAAENWVSELEKYKSKLDENVDRLGEDDSPEQIVIIKHVINADEKIDRLINSRLLDDLAKGHFLTLFATFDSFTGDLLSAIYNKKSDLFSSLDRSMSISEMLTYGSVDDIKKIILASEIDAFRRKSYIEQFILLENRFGLKLRKFNNWPAFVECGQRRNLFTHCDGSVSEQYISICSENEFKLSEDIIAGNKLKLDPEYLVKSCNLIIEVIFKLGQTIWRKLFPKELEEADRQIINIQYDFLSQSDWACAIMAGDYAVTLPRHTNTVNTIMMTINYVIALKNCDLDEKANKLLDSIDWSALCNDFKLAEKVLRKEYDQALEIMEKLGKEGDFTDEHSYHVWPLFREFRQTEHFLKGYKKVYGYDFATKLKETAEESSSEAGDQITRKKEAIKTSELVNVEESCLPEEPQHSAP